MSKRGMTTHEASQVLGCSAAALRAWRRSGSGPRFFRAGRLIRYRFQDLDEWITLHLHPDCLNGTRPENRRPGEPRQKV
jgi:excisionase family DNA binding protein